LRWEGGDEKFRATDVKRVRSQYKVEGGMKRREIT
jgi:hypothetical protein